MGASRDNMKASALDMAPGLGMDWECLDQGPLQSVIAGWELLREVF